MIKSHNPANGEVIAVYEPLDHGEVDWALDQAHKGFHDWRKTGWAQRVSLLASLAKVLRSKSQDLALQMTREMGKPIAQSLLEVEKCAAACEFYSHKPATWLGDEVLVDSSPKVKVSFQPLGVIVGIMPWNFPLWQVIRFFIPTTLAGNTVLLKHAESTWGTASAILDCLREAGYPEGVYQDFRVGHDEVAKVLKDSRVQGVSLTGSTRAGKQVAAQAGESLKRSVLELGGSDPYVVLHDADIQLAARKSVEARMVNGGQSCIAGKRFIVDQRIHDDFLNEILTLMRQYKMQNPEEKNCRLGPMARLDLRDQLRKQVQIAIEEGARSHLPDESSPDPKGYYHQATVLSGIKENSIVFREELFGPIACVIKAVDEQEALRLANATNYGLGAAIFSRDVERAEYLAQTELQAGIAVINGMVRSDPRWPFGGIKESGYGRELTQFGAREFVNIKTIISD